MNPLPFENHIKIANRMKSFVLPLAVVVAIVAFIAVGLTVGDESMAFTLIALLWTAIGASAAALYALFSLWEVQATMANADAWKMRNELEHSRGDAQ